MNSPTQPRMFPALTTPGAFQAWRADRARWLPAVTDIARGHALPCDSIEAFATGTNLVVALDGGLILKLFPPLLRSQFTSERIALTQLKGHLSVPIPEVIAHGEREQWSYLVITRLDGMPGAGAWPLLPERQKEIVLQQIGETIAELQRAPLGELAQLEPNWKAFIANQIEGCRTTQQRLGLPDKYLAGLDALLRQASGLIPVDAPPVILTGEFIPENILLSCDGDRWKLSGVIDFGDVMTGWGEYDLLGPSAFMTAGMPRRVSHLLRGYGYSAADIDQALTRRLLILMLLHRASDPVKHICIENWQDKAATLDELERLLWPL
jgi:hygromycin-B 7''-O-kinase